MSAVMIDVSWLRGCSGQSIPSILQEYRYFVHRFPQWLALTIGRATQERVRQLLLPNLVEECGSFDGAPSHLALLDRTLASCDIRDVEAYVPTKETRASEAWFYRACSEERAYASLCVLGPGTEAISHSFLDPLEDCVRHAYAGRDLDLEYFAVHKTEVEAKHAEQIEEAIQVLEAEADSETKAAMKAERARWSQAGIDAHAKFWSDLHRHLQSQGLLPAGAD